MLIPLSCPSAHENRRSLAEGHMPRALSATSGSDFHGGGQNVEAASIWHTSRRRVDYIASTRRREKTEKPSVAGLPARCGGHAPLLPSVPTGTYNQQTTTPNKIKLPEQACRSLPLEAAQRRTRTRTRTRQRALGRSFDAGTVFGRCALPDWDFYLIGR